MRIEYLRMRNFANIYSATNKRDIQINFPNNGKKVFLLVGANGSGKTSIMDQLHPFVENGSTRTVRDLLIPSEKEGHTLEAYKEIHIRKGQDLYKVKHFVDSQGRVKSFVYKNDVDLNPNGNVMPFKEIIENELYVNQDFLRLLSLGANSGTFIDMSSTERKKFISELMSEIEFYNQAFKNASEESRMLRRMLQNVVDEQRKNEVDSGEEHLKGLTRDLEAGEKHRDLLLTQTTRARTLIEQNAPQGHIILKERVTFLKDREKVLIREMNQEYRDISIVDKDISNTSNSLVREESTLSSMKDKMYHLIDTIDSNYKEVTQLESELSRLSSEKEIIQTKDQLDRLYKRIEEGKELYGKGKGLKVTKDQLTNSLLLLEEVEERTNSIYGFDNDEVKRVVASWINKTNIEQELLEELEELNDELTGIRLGYQTETAKKGLEGKPTPIILKKASCDCDCPFESFYQEALGIKKPKSVSQKEHDIEREIERVEEAMAVQSNLRLISMTLDANFVMIKDLPFDYLMMDKILQNIYDELPIYDESKVTSYIQFIEKHKEYEGMLNDIKVLETELLTLKKSDQTVQVLHKSLTDKKNVLETDRVNLEKLQEKLKEQTNLVDQIKEALDRLVKEKEVTVHSLTIKEERDRVTSDLSKLVKKLDIVETETETLDYNTKLYNQQKHMNDKMRYNINQISRKIENFKELEEKRKVLAEDFEDAQVIRQSLSSSEGIPLIYMNLYMSQTLADINDILDIVYDGRIEIPRFDIDSKEFSIPYVNNGIEISDVRQASQGESSFISIAVSFAFVSRSMERHDSFNIPRFDELDAALDVHKRNSFLDIIELQIEKINAEQIFIISHNQAFDNYPVNVLELTPGMVDSYTNKTKIEIE